MLLAVALLAPLLQVLYHLHPVAGAAVASRQKGLRKSPHVDLTENVVSSAAIGANSPTLIIAAELKAYFASREEEEEEGRTAEPSLDTCSTNAQASDAAASSHNTPAEKKRPHLVSCK